MSRQSGYHYPDADTAGISLSLATVRVPGTPLRGKPAPVATRSLASRIRAPDHAGINIEDDMAVLVRYASGAKMSYHLTAYSPWEGFRVAFNGTKGASGAAAMTAVTPRAITGPWEQSVRASCDSVRSANCSVNSSWRSVAQHLHLGQPITCSAAPQAEFIDLPAQHKVGLCPQAGSNSSASSGPLLTCLSAPALRLQRDDQPV